MTATQPAFDAVPISAGAVVLPAVSANKRSGGPIRMAGRVLLAEDGLDNQQIISLFLRRAGAEVTIAENGRVAIESVTAHPPDLILMDIDMPELDGHAATRQLRAEGCLLPIIALTAHSDADDQRACLAAGCTDYIAKPVEKNALLVSVAAHLCGERRGVGPIATAAAAPLAGRGLRSSFADEIAMQAPIAEFVAMLPYRVGLMQLLLRERNLPELWRVVHQLKGAGGGYGFDAITKFAARLDQLLKQEKPAQTLAGELDLLIELLRSVEGYQPSRERFHG